MKLVPLVSALIVARCGIKPGEYQVYRIAASESESTADCFGPDGEDPDDADDSSTFRAGQTIAIFASGDGTYFLDTPDVVLEGTKDGGLFTFDGTEVDVEYFGANDTSSTTATTTWTVTLDPAGDKVSGEFTQDSSLVCDGADCGGTEDTTCSTTSAFVGTRVRGVELEHGL